MILKVIFAVYFSLLIQPTLMTPLKPMNIIRREAEYLMKTLNETCSMLKNTTCKQVTAIELDFTVDLDKKELCTTVENVFCQIDESLKKADRDICRNNMLSCIQESQFVKRTNSAVALASCSENRGKDVEVPASSIHAYSQSKMLDSHNTTTWKKGKDILPGDHITMNEFCSRLKDYVQRLYNRC